ncbi:hypothetical protein QGN23_12210 [Chryseobacterium gotjawalense]|uniref:Peptidoglycan-binding protein LysM n=1 Tax=Chryseobacterium gotjawalense TaxID=3042315 RepID=A0ABY8RB48_9FLAO|nr:hypothetical protein [Chryseobacterium sp. wdc7]WHF51185.1 hypothetical protein QGN23_12210 [Chryseobacterium sp. wdc7]
MKKAILFATFLGGLFAANAQTAGPATGDVTLNVNLYPLQSIVVNPSKVVDLDYKTSADYLNGVNKTEVDHLNVFSTGAFDVKVKSTDTNLSGAGTAIPLTDIKIIASQGTTTGTTPLIFVPASEVALSGTEQIIGGSTAAGSGNISVNYKAAGNNDYLSRVVGGAKTTYTANLVYSIIAK